MSKALLVIDLQNDYFPGGAFPLWNPEAILEKLEGVILRAQAQGIFVIHVQHVAAPARLAPFFKAGTPGAEIHPRILALAPNAPVVVKAFADAFHQTTLEATLENLGVTELLLTGMMTQNCVTHTALSRAAEKYEVSILPDCCTTVSESLHLIALNAVSTRMNLVPSAEAF